MKRARCIEGVTVVALLLGWTTAAFPAVLTCQANAAVPPTLRAEGLTELVGDVVISGTGGTPFGAGVALPKVNITVFLSPSLETWLGATLASPDWPISARASKPRSQTSPLA